MFHHAIATYAQKATAQIIKFIYLFQNFSLCCVKESISIFLSPSFLVTNTIVT